MSWSRAEGAALPLIRHDLGLSYAQVGLLASVPLLVGGLLELPLGVLAGRAATSAGHSRRRHHLRAHAPRRGLGSLARHAAVRLRRLLPGVRRVRIADSGRDHGRLAGPAGPGHGALGPGRIDRRGSRAAAAHRGAGQRRQLARLPGAGRDRRARLARRIPPGAPDTWTLVPAFEARPGCGTAGTEWRSVSVFFGRGGFERQPWTARARRSPPRCGPGGRCAGCC